MIYPCNSSHLLGIPNHLHTFSNNFPSRRANNPWWNRIQRIGVSKFYTGNFVYLDGDHSYGYGLIGIWDISCPNFLNHPAMMQRPNFVLVNPKQLVAPAPVEPVQQESTFSPLYR